MNGDQSTNTRRMTLALGAAAGGMLASAFLSTAVAFADTTPDLSGGGGFHGGGGFGPTPVGPSPSPIDVFNFEPTGWETDVSTTDLPRGLGDISTGTQEFDVIDTSLTGDPTVGTFDASVTDTDILGVTNVEDVVTSDLTASLTASTGDPTVGSLYDTTTFDNSGYSIVLTDIPSTTAGGAPDITGAVDTPFGDYTLPPALDSILADILGAVGAVGADGATAATGAAADTVGTAAIDSLTGLLGLF
jgi:hypothetical protein